MGWTPEEIGYTRDATLTPILCIMHFPALTISLIFLGWGWERFTHCFRPSDFGFINRLWEIAAAAADASPVASSLLWRQSWVHHGLISWWTSWITKCQLTESLIIIAKKNADIDAFDGHLDEAQIEEFLYVLYLSNEQWNADQIFLCASWCEIELIRYLA